MCYNIVLKHLKNASIIGVLEGGHSVSDRIASAKETAKRPVAGIHTYFIDI